MMQKTMVNILYMGFWTIFLGIYTAAGKNIFQAPHILHVQMFHYICYTCYLYFVEFIIHLVVNAKRSRDRRKCQALMLLLQSTELLNNSFIHTPKTYHLKISICTEQTTLLLTSISYLFLITSLIVWLQRAHHMANTGHEFLATFPKGCEPWGDFFTLLAYRDTFYSLFSLLSIHVSGI